MPDRRSSSRSASCRFVSEITIRSADALPSSACSDRAARMISRATKTCAAVAICFSILSLGHASAQSEAERLEKLERAVEQLQKRNSELEQEVQTLKHKAPAAP